MVLECSTKHWSCSSVIWVGRPSMYNQYLGGSFTFRTYHLTQSIYTFIGTTFIYHLVLYHLYHLTSWLLIVPPKHNDNPLHACHPGHAAPPCGRRRTAWLPERQPGFLKHETAAGTNHVFQKVSQVLDTRDICGLRTRNQSLILAFKFTVAGQPSKNGAKSDEITAQLSPIKFLNNITKHWEAEN